MPRLLLTLLLLVSSGLAAVRTQEVADSPRKLRIDFVAIDRKGQPVTDLTQHDIEVWIGHFRVPIETLTMFSTAAGDVPSRRPIVLLIDDVTVAPVVMPRARDAARAFLNKMTPGDRVSLVTLSGVVSETAAEPARLRAALDRINVRATAIQRSDVLSGHVLETVAGLARQIIEAPGFRKTLVAIGTGPVFDRPLLPPGAGLDVQPQWVDAMRALAFSHAHLYIIDPGGVGAAPVDGGQDGFARATGGHAFLSTNDPASAADRILRDASNYYVATVADPPVGRKSDLREIEVRVHRSGVTVLAPRAIPGVQ